ncbi:MAG: four helix bundle protein [Saprospiraceae bacterium]|nr:four helix bundle protein [Saprospiraceae bacterium]MCF8251605.1 four helix bundle protein [Saprospiraceae bacterium]MCF8282067.1 four helix bundle protein [Bacteroidales bacterium]MCF8313500.1 four helix bundle protein [Saprospiraceae bacterium]MCF8442241.1 four helix bundle protein [Saprospiraceae bacterium]
MENGKINKIKQLRLKYLGEKVSNSESGKVVKEKSFAFAIRVVKLKQHLNKVKKEFSMSAQLQDSGTSIGANVREAYRGESNPDFVHKLGVSLKECNESQFWLELLFATEYITEAEFESIYADALALDNIITSIILTKKRNMTKK